MTANYLANNYANISTITRTRSFFLDPYTGENFADATEENVAALLTQKPLDNFYLLNLVGGKSWLKKGKYIGVFASVKAFEEKILREESFELFVLRSDHVNEVAEKLGPLQKEEVYIPTPYPFLGGDEAVDSYSKGNIWIMLDIVGQFHDVCT